MCVAILFGVDSWITGIVESMSYWGIGLLMALENIFPPVPSELIMPLGGYTSSTSGLALWAVIAVGSIGSLLGTFAWYGVGRWIEKDKVFDWVERHGHWLTLERDDVERAVRWFGKHHWIVAVGRVIPGVRSVVSLPAGFCRMSIPRFLAYTLVGTLVWTGVLAYLGSLLGKNYEQVGRYIGPVTYVVLGAILLVYVVRLVRMRRRAHRHHQGDHATS